jgi:hypothetical protein
MWMLSNATLAILIENISGLTTNEQQAETELRTRQNMYFRFILWATFGLSAVRFLGVRPYGFFTTIESSMLTRLSRSACGTSSSATSSSYVAGNKGPCAMRKRKSGRFHCRLDVSNSTPGPYHHQPSTLDSHFLLPKPRHNPILRRIVMDFYTF